MINNRLALENQTNSSLNFTSGDVEFRFYQGLNFVLDFNINQIFVMFYLGVDTLKLTEHKGKKDFKS